MFFLPETKNAKLIDKLSGGREKEAKQNEEDSKLVYCKLLLPDFEYVSY